MNKTDEQRSAGIMIAMKAVTGTAFSDAVLLVSEVENVALIKLFKTAASAERELRYLLSNFKVWKGPSKATLSEEEIGSLIRDSWEACISPNGSSVFRLQKVTMAA